MNTFYFREREREKKRNAHDSETRVESKNTINQ